ncbi:MAG: hypothetical protein L6Q59_02380 [Ignavibacteriaceae bacterium]|nr:hypothetical protein [Ignavibacteriaceae bacterium]
MKKISLVLFLMLGLFIGCGKKEKPEEPKKEPVKTETKADSVAKEPEMKLPALEGTWAGGIGQYPVTLTLNAIKNDEEVTGKVVISFRNPVSYSVKGTYAYKTGQMTLTDADGIRSGGSFSGTVSEDGKTFSGTYTETVSKVSSAFNLTKK